MDVDINKMESDDSLLVDPEDLEHVLLVVEQSYDIRFVERELAHIRTFADLSDAIISKIQLEEKDDCTDQQGFYKLRQAICSVCSLTHSSIAPSTDLASVLPKVSRRKRLKMIERALGFKLYALRPKHWIVASSSALMILSLLAFFVDWRYACSGLALSIALSWIVGKTGIEFKDETIGDLVRRMTSVNYLKSRSDTGSINRKEIEQKIALLLRDQLGLPRVPERNDVLI
jgi:hypothetical protein